MKDPIETFLQMSGLKTSLFPVTSRYHGVEIATLETPEGKPIVYLRRRFLPPPEQLVLVQEHRVAPGDRLDNLAAQYLGDPEQFWRICDANGAMSPDELIERIGRRLRITLPEGVPGT